MDESIKDLFNPLVQWKSGTTAHGNIPFRAPFLTEIVPGSLWQGGTEEGMILPKFIEHWVTLYTAEEYAIEHQVGSVLKVRMLDSLEQDTGQVDHVARWVNACRETGPVAVTCQAGLNRSGLVVARALMLEGRTADEAIALIREKRSPAVLCNPAFEEWLRSLDAPGGSYPREPETSA